MILTVYLGGNIKGCSYDEANDWRKHVKNELGFTVEVISPMRGKDYLLHELTLKDSYEDSVTSKSKSIIERDSFDVCRCDILILNLLNAKSISIGSMIELGWATAPSSHKRIVITIMEDDSIHEHRFIRELSAWVVPDVESAIDIVQRIAL